MKRVSILLACIMAAFALAACSPEAETLEDVVAADNEYTEAVSDAEEGFLDDAADTIKDFELDFKDNTVILKYTLAKEITSEVMTAGEFESAMKTDEGIADAAADVTEGIDVESGEIKIQIIVYNPDGSEYVNFIL